LNSPGGAAAARQQSAPASPRVNYANRQASAIGYLKTSNPGEDDHLGATGPLAAGNTMAMSRDGNTIAVSAPREDSAATGINGNQKDDSAYDAGAVYVFVRTGNRWSQQAYIKASNTGGSDQFGFAIALSGDGNTLAVGATREDSSARGINGSQADNSAESSGAVYVFTRTGGRWSQQAYVKASNADAGDQFGWALALSDDGNTMAVGATSETSAAKGVNGNQADNSADEAGAAYVFTRSGTTWSQQAYLKASNARGGDRFGFCAALSSDGNTLALCGYDEDGGATGVNGEQITTMNGSGCAYLFERRGTTWSQVAYVKASNTERGDAFGSSIAISGDGNTLAVGAVDEDGITGGIDSDQSHVQIGEWSAGAVYVYGKTNGVWAQQAYMKPTVIKEFDQFGLRLALSTDGSVLAAGAPLETGGGRGINTDPKNLSANQSGGAYIFMRNAGKWSQHAYIKAPNADEFDEFGSAIGLSGDGNTLVVAARCEDSGATGFGGNQADNSVRDSGALYIF
jgi:hypothetical protein